MAKTHSEIRMETARKRLSDALKNLEKVTKEKLHQTVMESKVLDLNKNDEEAEVKLVQQASLIQNLNTEINNLQRNLSELGKESDFLSEQNKALNKKIGEFSNEKNSFIKSIEADLLKIEEIINKEE